MLKADIAVILATRYRSVLLGVVEPRLVFSRMFLCFLRKLRTFLSSGRALTLKLLADPADNDLSRCAGPQPGRRMSRRTCYVAIPRLVTGIRWDDGRETISTPVTGALRAEQSSSRQRRSSPWERKPACDATIQRGPARDQPRCAQPTPRQGT